MIWRLLSWILTAVLLILLILALLIVLIVPLPLVRRRRWALIGEGVAPELGDRNLIPVASRRPSRERFRSLRLRSLRGAVALRALTIHFAGGAAHRVELGDWLPAGGPSCTIDLPVSRQNIRGIELHYERPVRERPPRRALVRVYGFA
jgi:hypothetical protein